MSIRLKTDNLKREDRRLRLVSRLIVYFFALLCVYPVFFVLMTSLKSDSEFYRNIWLFPKNPEWSNYGTAWVVGRLGAGFTVSILVTLVSITCVLVFGTFAGYALARLKVPFSGVILLLILITFMLPSEAVITPLYLLLSRFGLRDYALLIVPYVGWSVPMTVTIMRNFFLNMPNELLESARVDGCSELQSFAMVSVPLMSPAIAVSAIFAFVGVWGELIWAQIALSTTSTLRTLTMSMLQFQGQYNIAWGPMSAAICIIILPLMVFFIFTQKYFVQGIISGAVKG